MDNPITLFPAGAEEVTDADAPALVEIDAAIALVVNGHATRVRLTAIPFVGRVAGIGAAHAQAAGVAFRIEGADRTDVLTVTVGPRG